MDLESTKFYLTHFKSKIINNNIIVSLLCLIELLPIIYYSLLSSFLLFNKVPPDFITKYLIKISYVNYLSDFYNNDYPYFYLIIIFVIFLIFIAYKYFLQKLKILDNQIFKKIVINIYEFLIFRLLPIIFLDIAVNKFYSKQILNKVFGGLSFIFYFLFILIHFDRCHILINLDPVKIISFDNNLLLIYDESFLVCKLLICFMRNNKENESLSKFFEFCVFLSNYVIFFYQTYLLIKNKFMYLSNEINNLGHFIFSVVLAIMQLYISLASNYQLFYFCYFFANSLLIGFVLSYLIRTFSIDKILSEDNQIGRIIFLINECNASNSDAIVYKIINIHKCTCFDKDCKFCLKIKSYKNQKIININYKEICVYIYKYLLVKKDVVLTGMNVKEVKRYTHIIQLYMCYLNQNKNLIKIVLKFNKIKSLITGRNLSGDEDNSNKVNSTIYTFNFNLNLNLLYNEISQSMIDNNDSSKMSYIIPIDGMSAEIKSFMKKITNYFKMDIKSPKELIRLSNGFTYLTKKVDFEFLSSKENRYLYPCVLTGYILEEIFSEQLSKNCYFVELIRSLDDLLEYKYKNDRIILIYYDIANSYLTVKQCGRAIIKYKDSYFENIFPPFLRLEGKKRVIKLLKRNSDEEFNYYFYNEKKETVENFKMNFLGIPSLDFNNNFLYIICKYRIEKDNILIFENKYDNSLNCKCLVLVSETTSKFLNISQQTITLAFENKQYIKDTDLFTKDYKHISYTKVQNILQKNFGMKDVKFDHNIKLEVIPQEKIDKYEVYVFRENIVNNQIDNTKVQQTNLGKTSVNISENSKEENGDYSVNFKGTTGTGGSSSVGTSSQGGYKNKETVKDQQTHKYKKFFIYTYYIICFNIFILGFIIVFFIIELVKTFTLENTYDVILNFNNFQSYFYVTSLSIFSLGCNAESLVQTECVSQFKQYSENFIRTWNLNEDQSIVDYVSRELTLKNDEVISTLKQWESEQDSIDSDELLEILSKEFVFNSIEEVSGSINIVQITLTFEEAIRRYVNIINLVTASSNFLTSPVYTVSSDGNDAIDMTNCLVDKQPVDGQYLNDAQKFYYTIVLNYQKYILRLLSIGDLLQVYFENMVSSTSFEILIYIMVFIVLHIIMMFISILFILKFKVLHMEFFIIIYDKTSDKDFIDYYYQKVEIINVLLDLYKENPNELMNNLARLKQKEYSRKVIESKKENGNYVNIDGVITLKNQNNINMENLDKIYHKEVINSYIIRLVTLYAIYIIICLSLFFLIRNSINDLTLMSEYCNYNYVLTNNLVINLGLVQIMSLTNQTDIMLKSYFNNEDLTTNNTEEELLAGYVRGQIDETITLSSLIEKLEKNSANFESLDDILDLDCETIFPVLKDPFIEKMISLYPQTDYYLIFENYCKSVSSIQEYKSEKMTVSLVAYQTGKLLDMFVGRTYEIYAKIGNSDILFTLYSNVLLLLRPLRNYINSYIVDHVIVKIMNKYKIFIVLFLAFNLVYETIILLVMKYKIINKIVQFTKEIIIVGKAFECFN